MKHILLILSCLLLSSCSFLSPQKCKPSNQYLLTNIPYVTHHKETGKTVLVNKTEAVAAFNTSQMAYSIRPHEIAYFADNEWAETPNQMFQPLLVQALQNSNFYHAVVSAPTFALTDYTLNTQVISLIQDFTVRPSQLRMNVQAQIIKNKTNRVIAAKSFQANETIFPSTPYGGVLAANRATAKILSRLVNFTIHHT